MGPAATYALMTFLVGLLTLLGWIYATYDNPRGIKILKKSLLLFGLPIIFAPSQFVVLHIGMWAWVACEEALKAFASTRERRSIDRFWLVSLFAVWELTLSKPLWGLVLAQSAANSGRLEIVGLVYAAALPVLLHLVTAAIYAFGFSRRLWAAFTASWAVHFTFNEAVRHFGMLPAPEIVETFVLGAVLFFVLHLRPPVVVENN